MSTLLSILLVLVVVFVVSSIAGLFLAFRDIRKNKNTDNTFRKSRKEIINECFPRDNTADLMGSINNLSDSDKEVFRSELLKKFDSMK